MRNSENYITTTGSEPLATDDETTWSFPGAIIGFVSWLLALGIPFLIYGGNTLFFFLHLAFLPGADARGGCRRHCAALAAQWQAPVQCRGHDCDGGLMFGLLFLWLMG
jgi:hypothetical protein